MIMNMDKTILLQGVLLNLLLICEVNFATPATPPKNSMQEDYFWRDCEGNIPHDAFKGGLDSRARPIYIGQVLYETKIIPGKIYEDDPKIYFEWGHKEHSTTQNVKIFCTKNPNKFQWEPTKHNEFALLPKKILVKGGYEKNYSTYIGRAFTDGQTLVGKVMCQSDQCLGLYTTSDGHFKEHKIYEILTYDPDIPEVDKPNVVHPQIDVDVRHND